ncbi:MAG: VanZ family protein [Chloroflexi bacterium]|nr:VanZ family protein [Chloroflexota bacterium]
MKQILSWFDHRALRWTAAIVWSVWITILLIQPEADPIINLGLPSGPQTFLRELFFTCMHVLAFAITCALWQWALSASMQIRASIALACIIAIVLGASTEYLQTLSPDRYPSWTDLIADCYGSLQAAWFIWRRSADHRRDKGKQAQSP